MAGGAVGVLSRGTVQVQARRSRSSVSAAVLKGALLCAWAVALVGVAQRGFGGGGLQTFTTAGQATQGRGQRPSAAARRVGPTDVPNPVRTVSETVGTFYKEYPQPPVLPMYRTFLVDLMTQAHLMVVDSRFKYDAIWALGFIEFYNGLMGSYDKMVGGEQASKILSAMTKALGLDLDKVKADAEAAKSYASSTTPGDILKHMEGTEAASDARISEAFSGIGKSLFSNIFSIGLFKVMELSGVETSKDNVEEWAKALKVSAARATSDLETYKMNKGKLQKAEEMLREIEIREKKKLAERLEAKAKALAEKASAKKAAAESGSD